MGAAGEMARCQVQAIRDTTTQQHFTPQVIGIAVRHAQGAVRPAMPGNRGDRSDLGAGAFAMTDG